jgi:hypothetical protein
VTRTQFADDDKKFLLSKMIRMPRPTSDKYIIFYNGKELWLDPIKVAQHPDLETHFKGQAREGSVTLFGDDRAIQLFANWIHYGNQVLDSDLQRYMSKKTPELSAAYEKLAAIFDYFNLLVPVDEKIVKDYYNKGYCSYCSCFVRLTHQQLLHDPPYDHLYNCHIHSIDNK